MSNLKRRPKASSRVLPSPVQVVSVSVSAPRKKAAWTAALSYLTYILFLFRIPLLHPKVLLSGYDMPIFYAYKLFWVQSIKAGDPAIWNPYSSFGNSFLGDPGVGFFSPFNLLHFFLSPTYAFTWEAILHFWLAAFGTYLFMRSIGSRPFSAFFSGFVFAFGAFLIINSAAAQCILWWAAAWIPMILYCLNETIETRKMRWFLATSVCLALSYFEGEPQITQYNFMFCGFYLLYAWLAKKMPFRRMALVTAGLVVIFLLLVACGLIPAMEYAELSNRWGWKIGNIMTENLTPASLQTFLHPFYQGSPLDGTYHGRWGYHASTNYIGWVPLGLFFVGLFYAGRIPKFSWMMIMALFFTTLSMGDSTAFSNWFFMLFYHYVPFFAHHRTISRMMVLTQFAMACGAGLVLDHFIEKWRAWRMGKTPGIRLWVPWFALLIFSITFVELLKFDLPFEATVDAGILTNRDQVFPEPMMTWALNDKGYYRVQPVNRICANLYWHLFQPITYDDTMDSKAADYLSKWDQNPDSPLSDVMALKYVFHPRIQPTSVRFKQLSTQIPYAFVNREPLPRAFMVGGYQVIKGGYYQAADMIENNRFDYRHEILLEQAPLGLPVSSPQDTGEVRITHFGNNEVLMHCHANKPGLLFLSDVNFPGWTAKLNGKTTKILTADGLFRAVVIPQAGDYDLRMSYWPTHLTAGLVISSLGWVCVLGCLVWYKKEEKTVLS